MTMLRARFYQDGRMAVIHYRAGKSSMVVTIRRGDNMVIRLYRNKKLIIRETFGL